MGWIHLNVWFFKVRSAVRIPILILNNERTSYVSRSSFVSQVRLADELRRLPAAISSFGDMSRQRRPHRAHDILPGGYPRGTSRRY